jgi:TRAP-type C4-dicarboxylate transport system permease large subunit
MDSTLLIALILVLAVFRTPLFLILAALSIVLFNDVGENLASIIVSFTEISKQSILLAIPLFTFAGFILSESKTPARLINLANSLFGFLPGGIAIVTLITCAVFTAFTGASGVTIIALGGLLYPILIKQNYPEKFTLGLLTTSGSLGLLFPPSLPIIIYGIVSRTDIGDLFVAGLLPGSLLVFILALYAIRTGKVSTGERSVQPIASRAIISQRLVLKNLVKLALALGVIGLISVGFLTEQSFVQFLLLIITIFVALQELLQLLCNDEARSAFSEAKYEVFLPILVLTGIYSGQFTPTESASVTALYVIIIECFLYKDVSFKRDLPKIVQESMILVGAILIIMAAALAFTNYLVDEEIPDAILAFIQQYIDSQIMFLIALNILLLIVGSIMDIFSAILVVVPLIVPIAAEYQIHPVHLGIIFLTNLEIGYMTPPVGLNLFISSFRFEKNIVDVYKAAVPYIVMLFIALIIITYVPSLSLMFVD